MLKKLKYNNITFSINVESEIEESRFETAFSKEPETIKWIEEFIHSGEVFLDVGANIGIYSLYAAARHPKLNVIACEPAFHNFYKLCQNIIANKYSDRVQPLGIGIGEKSSYARLHLSSLKDGSASHSIDEGEAQKNADENTLTHVIAIASIDGLISEGMIEVPQHIKIDVDGFETAVVRGMKRLLESDKLVSVLIELDHELADTKEIFEIMKEAGFVTDHSINSMQGHSRERRVAAGHGHIENVIFTR